MKLRIILPLMLVAVFISTASMAQFHIGAKVGVNVSKVDGASFKDQFRYGYQLGGFAEIPLSDKFGLQPEVMFNQYSTTLDSNYSHTYQNLFSSDQAKVKLNYLSIPLLLNYKLIGNFLSLQAGPQFSILMNQQKTLLQNGGAAFSNGDFSMLAGAQIKIASFRVGARYAVGLNNINDLNNKEDWKSQGFQVSVGIAL